MDNLLYMFRDVALSSILLISLCACLYYRTKNRKSFLCPFCSGPIKFSTRDLVTRTEKLSCPSCSKFVYLASYSKKVGTWSLVFTSLFMAALGLRLLVKDSGYEVISNYILILTSIVMMVSYALEATKDPTITPIEDPKDSK